MTRSIHDEDGNKEERKAREAPRPTNTRAPTRNDRHQQCPQASRGATTVSARRGARPLKKMPAGCRHAASSRVDDGFPQPCRERPHPHSRETGPSTHPSNACKPPPTPPEPPSRYDTTRQPIRSGLGIEPDSSQRIPPTNRSIPPGTAWLDTRRRQSPGENEAACRREPSSPLGGQGT